MTALAYSNITARPHVRRRPRSRLSVLPQEQYGALSAATLEPDEAPDEVPSVFSARREPDWLDPVLSRLSDLILLPEGWDGHGGKEVNIDTAAFALQFLFEMLDPATPPPQIVPLSYGGLQLEWHEKGIDLEIEVLGPNDIYVSYEDSQTRTEFEDAYKTDFRNLAGPIDELTNRPEGIVSSR